MRKASNRNHTTFFFNYIFINKFLNIAMTVSVLSSLKHDELVEELEWRIGQLPHHRDKRFAFLTDEKRFVMPPGSQMVLTPTLALPVIR